MPTITLDSLEREERLFEKEELELEILFGRIKKGDFHSKWDILKKVNEFIAVVEDILRKLEAEKRNNEQVAYRKLQEIYELLELIKDTGFEGIKKDLEELKETIKDACKKNDKERRLEKRIERGRKIYGFHIKKARSSVGRDREVLAASLDIAERTPKEIKKLNELKNLITQIKQKGSSEELTKQEHTDVSKLVMDLKKDFFEIFTIEVDIDIEEAEKLKKIRRIRRLLEALRINDRKKIISKYEQIQKGYLPHEGTLEMRIHLKPRSRKDVLQEYEEAGDLVRLEEDTIKKLKELEGLCRVWAHQDRTTEEKLESLTKKLEEKTTRIIEMKEIGPVSFRLIINPYDNDFNSFYDEVLAKTKGWDPKDVHETKKILQLDMSRKEWFCLVAKVGNKVVGGVYFGYYIFHKWGGAIGYSGYDAVRRKYQGKELGPKLVQLSEYYLKRIAYQKGYRLLMIIRFIPEKGYFPNKLIDRRYREKALKYLKKIDAGELKLSPEARYVDRHDQYIKFLKEFGKKKEIPKDLWLDFLAKITMDVNRADPVTDSDFQRIKKSLKSQGIKKIKLEEVNI